MKSITPETLAKFKSTASLGRSVLRMLAFGMCMALLFQIAGGWYVLHLSASRVLRAIQTDSAVVFANKLLTEHQRGRAIPLVLQDLQNEADSGYRNPYLLLLKTDGRILHHTRRCSLLRSQLAVEELRPFSSVTLPPVPPDIQPPCHGEQQFISAAELRIDQETMFLLLFADNPIVFYLQSPKGITSYVLWAGLFSIGILTFSFLLIRAAHRRIMGDAELLAQQLHAYVEGQRTARLPHSVSKELAEVSSVCNLLVEEHTNRVQSLEDDSERRRALSTTILHDLRTPLTAIENCLERIGGHADRSLESAQYLRFLHSSIGSQQQLSRNLLDLAELDERTELPVFQSCSIHLLFENCIAQILPIAEQRDVALELNAPEVDCTVVGEPALLSRVLLNILNNAVRYTLPGGEVLVSYRNEREAVRITVTDSGIGIPAGELPFVFKEFYRVQPKTTADPGGSGLGLAVVDRIMQIHGGSVEIESIVNQGTSVHLTLPHNQAAPVPPQADPPVEQHVPHANETIPPQSNRPPMLLQALLLFFLVVPFAAYLLEPVSVEMKMLSAACGIYFCLALYARQRSPFVKEWFTALLLVLLFCLTSAAITLESVTAVLVLGGGLAVLGLFTLHCSRRVVPVATTVVFAVSLPFFIGELKSIYLLGLIGGLFLGAFAWASDGIPVFRRLGIELLGVLLLCVLATSVALSGAIFLFSFSSYQAALRPVADDIAIQVATELSNVGNHPPELFSFLAEMHLKFPYADFHVFSNNGTLQAGSQPDAADGLRQRSPATVENGLFHFTGSSLTVRLAHARSHFSAAPFCPNLGCVAPWVFSVELPSQSGEHHRTRILQPLLAQYFLITLIPSAIVFWGLFATFHLLFAKRFQAVRLGLERYRSGDFKQPISLTSNDSLGSLFTALNALAVRLPELTEQAEHNRAQTRAFLRKIAFELSSTADELLSLLVEFEEDDGHLGSQASLNALTKKAHSQRMLLESLFELFRLEQETIVLEDDPIPLDEMLLEALDRNRSLAELCGVVFRYEEHLVEQFAVGSAEYTARAIDYLLQSMILACEGEGIVEAETIDRGDSLELRLAVDSGQLPILEENTATDSTVEANSQVLPYYWLSVYKEAFTRMNATLEVCFDDRNQLVAVLQFACWNDPPDIQVSREMRP